MTDIEIAQAHEMKKIVDVAAKAGIDEKHLELYGNYKAKLDLSEIRKLPRKAKLILVTAISPTPAGEGKTTTSVGLADGLRKLGKSAVAALREPSLGPVFGVKGGAAGGGYHSISPTILIAHQDANMAVGGAGIVGGMSPKGHVDKEAAEALIKAQKNLKSDIPGTVAIHYGETGFFREVYADEEGVLAGIRKYIDMLPAYDPEFFRVDDPKEPLFDANDLYSIVPFNQKRSYDMVEVLARLFDGSEFM